MDRVIKSPVRGCRDEKLLTQAAPQSGGSRSGPPVYSPPAVDSKTLTAPALKALYQVHRSSTQLRQTRQGLWLAALVYLLFGAADALLIPDVAFQTVIARVVVAVSALAVVEVLVTRRVDLRWVDLSCAATVVMGYLAWLVPSTHTMAEDAFRYYMLFGTIFMMSANLFFNLVFRMSVLTSLTIFVIFLISMFYAPALSFAQSAVIILFYASCFLFTSYVNWKLNEERYNVFLNAIEAAHQHDEAEKRGVALERLSNTDYLTGLENRRAVDKRLRDHWNDWQTEGKAFAAILVDVDFFKKYNDFYGHQSGDRCLILVANVLSETLKPLNASVGRYGGEEFIVLSRVTGRDQVMALGEIIRSAVEGLHLVHDQRRDGQAFVTVSVGASYTRPQTGPKLERIINEADRALYSAKANGRNCIRLFNPNDPLTSDDNENIAATLRMAIKNDLVNLVYQPIQNLKTGRVEAVESLMRMKMIDGTPLSPAQFIPVAERTGAILDLGLWAIRRACTEVLATGVAPMASVNVSAIQLKSRGFALAVSTILEETRVAGSQLAFEITEGIDMEGQSDVIRCITDLQALGIRIWLDDFGTGFAGLSWLRLFPFDTVKIDRSFLQDARRPAGRAMLEDIIRLIRNRGLKILIEGLETADHVELMHELGIELGQGYFLGRPAPIDEVRIKPFPRLASVGGR
ncbi:putative bifunctional diguanylate cyclase/phosphodiesterase [Rhizobium sp. 'Codium 1']|uniref:putative bifunctional diguanylate cyclase/phosphodiesterase n=1 Tax=Rhizobium sp. 'Codium 1' TaxID=2940484 RepID=UPI001E34CB34|nr:GGDEF domain-containing phosphodiesterase [Rhizobium sp. 'Codium 1']MCC8933786.1 EAL domain-containing protein [Rhizobium sp. 'Codium 1']